MAVYYGEDDDPNWESSDWPCVKIRRLFPTIEDSNVFCDFMWDWLKDNERPGRFSTWISGGYHPTHDVLDAEYYIEDANVAFEFKLRFA